MRCGGGFPRNPTYTTPVQSILPSQTTIPNIKPQTKNHPLSNQVPEAKRRVGPEAGAGADPSVATREYELATAFPAKSTCGFLFWAGDGGGSLLVDGLC